MTLERNIKYWLKANDIPLDENSWQNNTQKYIYNMLVYSERPHMLELLADEYEVELDISKRLKISDMAAIKDNLEAIFTEAVNNLAGSDKIVSILLAAELSLDSPDGKRKLDNEVVARILKAQDTEKLRRLANLLSGIKNKQIPVTQDNLLLMTIPIDDNNPVNSYEHSPEYFAGFFKHHPNSSLPEYMYKVDTILKEPEEFRDILHNVYFGSEALWLDADFIRLLEEATLKYGRLPTQNEAYGLMGPLFMRKLDPIPLEDKEGYIALVDQTVMPTEVSFLFNENEQKMYLATNTSGDYHIKYGVKKVNLEKAQNFGYTETENIRKIVSSIEACRGKECTIQIFADNNTYRVEIINTKEGEVASTQTYNSPALFDKLPNVARRLSGMQSYIIIKPNFNGFVGYMGQVQSSRKAAKGDSYLDPEFVFLEQYPVQIIENIESALASNEIDNLIIPDDKKPKVYYIQI